eukprot:COSAG02_NODE_14109_length_1309_cov_1.677686_1_plen_122_part_10
MCLASDKVSATEGEQARMRCPIWLAIPARDMGVRAEVYMQVHRIFQMPPLFARLWAQLSFGNPEPKEHDEFLSYSHMVTKIMSLRNGSTKWLRAEGAAGSGSCCIYRPVRLVRGDGRGGRIG